MTTAEPLDLDAIEARDATIRGSWIDMWRDDIRPGMLAICDRRDLLAEVKRLRDTVRLVMSALQRQLDAYAELSGLPAEYTDDDEVVYETIAGKVADAARLREQEQRIRELAVAADDEFVWIHPKVLLAALDGGAS